MSDMLKTIEPKSDQQNADDFLGGDRTITITSVNVLVSGEQRVSINFDGDENKPYKPCKSMCRMLVKAWGSESKNYVGKSLTLFCEPTVKWAGKEIGGIRISHMSHIDKPITMALTTSKANRKPFTVQPLKIEQPKPAVEKHTADIQESMVDGYKGEFKNCADFDALKAKFIKFNEERKKYSDENIKLITDAKNARKLELEQNPTAEEVETTETEES